MAIRHFKNEPENSEMDMFAFDYGTAIWLRSPEWEHIIVSSHSEADEYKRLGWKVKGTINRSDFQGAMGQID